YYTAATEAGRDRRSLLCRRGLAAAEERWWRRHGHTETDGRCRLHTEADGCRLHTEADGRRRRRWHDGRAEGERLLRRRRQRQRRCAESDDTGRRSTAWRRRGRRRAKGNVCGRL